MQCRGATDFRVSWRRLGFLGDAERCQLLAVKDINELLQEDWHTRCVTCRGFREAFRRLGLATADQFPMI